MQSAMEAPAGRELMVIAPSVSIAAAVPSLAKTGVAGSMVAVRGRDATTVLSVL